MPISEMKENLHALELFVSKYTDKNASFHYLLTTYPYTTADLSGILNQPAAALHLFRNELIMLICDLIERNPPENAAHIFDEVAIARSTMSQINWEDL